ncbi:MAG: hypothetical protein LBG92_12815 [Prevotellaceae bacterium]|jgi:hypothetical protein|nr:hypothetical protein [Prevotellaceae bacterium]
MKHSYIALILLFVSTVAPAQRSLKYENVAKKADATANRMEAFGMYSDFLSQNPTVERSNLYFKLAELSSAMMKDFDPLTDFSKIADLYSRSIDYYRLCLHFIDDDNVRKDQPLFQTVRASQRRMTAADVLQYVNLKRENDSVLFDDLFAVNNSFTSMIGAYYKCMELYRNLCETNRNVNDLYTGMDKNITPLNDIVKYYDSVFYYREKLGNKLSSLSFSRKSIEDFKIDGFTPTEFKTVAEIWDYKSWAMDLKTFYEKNIMPTLQLFSSVKNLLDNQINSIKTLKKPIPKQESESYGIMSKLIEIQSLTSYYSEIKSKYGLIDFLNLYYSEMNKPVADNYSVKQQSVYIYELTEAYNNALACIAELKSNYPAVNDDITDTVAISELYYQSIDNYKQYVINAENLSGVAEYAVQNKTNIPKFRGSGFYRPSSSGFVTKNILRTDYGLFLSGATISIQGFSLGYTAFAEDAVNINWLKTVDVSKLIYDDCVTALCPVPGGVMGLVSSKNVSDPNLTSQTIIRYDAKGNEKYKFTLPEKNLPLGRYILHDAITENSLMAFYGDREDWYQDSAKLIIKQLSKDNRQIFTLETTLNGKLLRLFHYKNGGFIVFGNYAKFDTEHEHKNVPGIFSLILDSEGRIVKTTTYDSETSIYGIHVDRAAPDRFIIAGMSGEIIKNDASPYPIANKPLIIVTDNSGNKIFNKFL